MEGGQLRQREYIGTWGWAVKIAMFIPNPPKRRWFNKGAPMNKKKNQERTRKKWEEGPRRWKLG